jgi:large subunit ribosomal protein L17
MRHRKLTIKLGRTAAHRDAMLANMVCSLIEHQRVTTTVAKAKAARRIADRMVTLGKQNTLHARRRALSVLRNKAAVRKLFEDVAPRHADRAGGYTRVLRLPTRQGDGADRAILEWVGAPAAEAPKPKRGRERRAKR